MTAKATRNWWAARTPEERAAYNRRRRDAEPLPKQECHGGGCTTEISSKFWLCRPCVASFKCGCGRPGKHYGRGLCNPCYQSTDERRKKRREAYRLQKYGITPEQYEDMLAAQNGVCAGCLGDKPLDIDHCHAAGTVRGLLCGDCNRALGLVRDEAETLHRLIRYLQNVV